MQNSAGKLAVFFPKIFASSKEREKYFLSSDSRQIFFSTETTNCSFWFSRDRNICIYYFVKILNSSSKNYRILCEVNLKENAKSQDRRFFLRMSSIRWKCIFWQITFFFSFFYKEKSNICRISEATTRNSQNLFFLPVDTRGLANCYKNRARFSNPSFITSWNATRRMPVDSWLLQCSPICIYLYIDWTRESKSALGI